MKVGRGRHPRVCSQLHPRADPGRTPPATKGWPWSGHRGTRKREKPVARWTGAYLLLASALARHTPSLWGKGKETGKPQARQNLGLMKLGCLTTEYLRYHGPRQFLEHDDGRPLAFLRADRRRPSDLAGQRAA